MQNSVYSQSLWFPIAFETCHTGESGVQLSVGVEMEACGDQATAVSNQFAICPEKSQAGSLRLYAYSGTISKVRQRSLNFSSYF